ncbi:MAG: uroporphyrinogen decarboxylase family protein [Chloroflexota bacterium]|nr:uroporphyrinogen decarboxylase family protein [Chloroflexota bacterium]
MHGGLAGIFRVYGQPLAQLFDRYPSDVLYSPVAQGENVARGMGLFAFREKSRGYWTEGQVTYDDWGCGWLYLTSDYMGQAVEYPLANWAALDSYRPPDPMKGVEGVQQMEEAVRKDGHRHFAYVDGGEVWQRMFFLRGYEDLLVDLLEDRPEVYALRDIVVEWELRRIERWLETKVVDAILIRDDWGSQTQLMVRPAIWRKVFKPAYKRIVDAIHSGGAFAGLHTDGYTWEIMPDLVEIGWDEVNPQVHLMDAEELGRRYGGKICFRPTLDHQHVLPYGTPEEVRAHAERMFNALGHFKGGFVASASVHLDMPMANVEAMLDSLSGLSYADQGVR